MGVLRPCCGGETLRLHASLWKEARAAGADPDGCSGSLWLTYMLLGEFEEAWRQSDDLRERGAPDEHRFWNGEEVRGKRLIVRCLHGFGDSVQMFRYAPRLKALAAEVVWEVPPRLVELARCFPGVDRVITWGEGAPKAAPEWDVQMEVMELPYFFRTSLAQLPIATRYLLLGAAETERVAGLMGPRRQRRVGIAWSSGDWNPSRDIPYAAIASLAESDDCEFWSLQTQPPPSPRMRHQMRTTGDGIMALAATIANLDLVITVDTLAAHLAGALGKPCWLLLQHAADWRWMHERSDSPWYQSLELIRQPSPGDWGTVVDTVQQRLATLKL